MATVTQQQIRGRPARKCLQCYELQMLKGSVDPSGPTFLTYTPNGKQLVTTGSNNVVRVYETGSDGEPTNLDDCQENNTAIAATVSFGAKAV